MPGQKLTVSHVLCCDYWHFLLFQFFQTQLAKHQNRFSALPCFTLTHIHIQKVPAQSSLLATEHQQLGFECLAWGHLNECLYKDFLMYEFGINKRRKNSLLAVRWTVYYCLLFMSCLRAQEREKIDFAEFCRTQNTEYTRPGSLSGKVLYPGCVTGLMHACWSER